MNKVKATLSRQVGPFTVGVWLIIVIIGIGLGLFIRRRMGGNVSASKDVSGSANVSTDTDSPYSGDFQREPAMIVPGRLGPGIIDIPNESRTDDGYGIGIRPLPVIVNRDDVEIGDAIVVERPYTPTPAPLTPTPAPSPTPTVSQPATTGRTYTVVRGDSLSRIGAKYGIPWRDIYNANKAVIGSNPDLIKPGQILVIPG